MRSSSGRWAVTIATYCPSGWWNIPNLSQPNPVADLMPLPVVQDSPRTSKISERSVHWYWTRSWPPPRARWQPCRRQRFHYQCLPPSNRRLTCPRPRLLLPQRVKALLGLRSRGALQAGIFSLKHESSIFRSLMQSFHGPCSFYSNNGLVLKFLHELYFHAPHGYL